ncbi:MAG TPA: glycoside hydrolase family 15 protein [Candidatus Limnocylindria bacterium]
MPRDLPLGNGDFLVTFDGRYQLRDIYYPNVGQENHTIGEACRFGVWADGAFIWIADGGWERQMGYEHETLVGDVRLRHAALKLALHCRDTVDFDRNIYFKEVTVEDQSGTDRDIRLFQHFDANLYGNGVGDSAFYDPRSQSIVHYKGRRYFLLSGSSGGHAFGLTSFAIGQKDAPGKEGTWRDAEDGELSRNPVAQGSIDSVGMVAAGVPANGSSTLVFWLAAGQSYDEVRESDKLVRERTPSAFLARTKDYWRLWANNDETLADHLAPELTGLYKRSTLIIRTQVDNRGAIIAGNDSDVLRFNRDTYSYLWPRDGALVADALDMAGYGEVTRRFFHLCGDLITREGYLLHKYNPDGSLGSSWHAWASAEGRLELPIQEDETGLPIWALWQHYDRDRDIEFVRPLYRKLVRAGADFMATFREPRTKLPAASFDLWEERRGIHAWTTAAVFGGLTAARNFAVAFGQHEFAKRYAVAAQEIRDAALTHLWDQDRGRFVRTVAVLPDGLIVKDANVDISLAGIFLFGLLPADDPRVVSTMRAIEERLTVRTPIGGIARYENDYYFQISQDVANVPGNPWFISTLWLAEWYIAIARTLADLERPRLLLEWCRTKALPSGVLAEQVHPYTGEPLSVSPLTWSHAAFVSAIQHYARTSAAIRGGLRDRAARSGEAIA